MSLLRRSNKTEAIPDSPATLFYDLNRSKEYPHLWSPQKEVLDVYIEQCEDKSDVAIELPTGSGKTLVGLLIAEYCRRKYNYTGVYLCPTKQLCHQVHEQAQLYGIPTVLLVGKQDDYPLNDFDDYQHARSTAISTYSGLFNNNPRITSPGMIFCDDAHAAGDYISDKWSVLVDKILEKDLYLNLLDALKPTMSPELYSLMLNDGETDVEETKVYLIPLPLIINCSGAIIDVLDSFIQNNPIHSLKYSWRSIRSNLEACNCYVSRTKIYIRPLIPPTFSHTPFSGAKQRIFISATISADGDIERITGRRRIERISAHGGPEKQGSGTRFILFPQYIGQKEDSTALIDKVVCSNFSEPFPQRTLHLVGDNKTVSDQSAQYHSKGVKVFTKDHVQSSLKDFINYSGPSVLLLANRFDGIDLPDDTCRKLVFGCMPIATNIQERFFWGTLGATAVLQDRIRTRIAQGLGRCTRNPTDYALVLIADERLRDWMSDQPNIRGMHPELQAEIEFGNDQSRQQSPEGFALLCQALLDPNSETWLEAKSEIATIRSNKKRIFGENSERLHKTTSLEVDYTIEMWGKNYEASFDLAESIAKQLPGDELRPYRAFWYYQCCISAYLMAIRSSQVFWWDRYNIYLDKANNATQGNSWLAKMPQPAMIPAVSTDNRDIVDSTIIIESLKKWGEKINEIENTINQIRKLLNDTKSEQFEKGLLYLGAILGCRSMNWPTENGAPDGYWHLTYDRGVVFEAKSASDPGTPISLHYVRQAQTHPQWVRARKETPSSEELITCFVSPQEVIEEGAKSVTNGLYYVSLGQIRLLFEDAIKALREVHAKLKNTDSIGQNSLVQRVYSQYRLSHDDLLSRLRSKNLGDLPTKSSRAGK